MPVRRFDTLKLALMDLQETEAEFNAVNQQVQKLTERRNILRNTLSTRKSIIFDMVSLSYTYELRTIREAALFVAIYQMLPSEQRPMLHHLVVQGLTTNVLEGIFEVLTEGGICIGFDKSIGRTPPDDGSRKMGTRLIEQNLPAKGKSSLVIRGGIEARGSESSLAGIKRNLPARGSESSLATRGGSESSLAGIKQNLPARGSESSLATRGGSKQAMGSESSLATRVGSERAMGSESSLATRGGSEGAMGSESSLATRGGSERRNLETRARLKSMDSPPYKLNKVDPEHLRQTKDS